MIYAESLKGRAIDVFAERIEARGSRIEDF
jgi:hypothetical protein